MDSLDWKEELAQWEYKLGDLTDIIQTCKTSLVPQEIWEAGGEQIMHLNRNGCLPIHSFFKEPKAFAGLKYIPNKCLSRKVILREDTEGTSALDYLCGLPWKDLNQVELKRVLKYLRDEDFVTKKKQGNGLTIAASWGNLKEIHKHFPKAITLEGLLEKDFSDQDAIGELFNNGEKVIPGNFSKKELIKNLDNLEIRREKLEREKLGATGLIQKPLGKGSFLPLDNLIIKGKRIIKIENRKSNKFIIFFMKLYQLIDEYRYSSREKDKEALEKIILKLQECNFKDLIECLPPLSIGSRKRTILELLLKEKMLKHIPKKAMKGLSIEAWLIKPPGRDTLLVTALLQEGEIDFKLNKNAINNLENIKKTKEYISDHKRMRKLKKIISKIKEFKRLKKDEIKL